MSIITHDDRAKLDQQTEELRSKVVGKYGAIRIGDLLSPRRLVRYHPREATLIGAALALALGAGLAYVLGGGRRRVPAPRGSALRAGATHVVVAVAAIAGAELARRVVRFALDPLRTDERLELPAMPEPDPDRKLSLAPPDVAAFTIKKRN